MTGRAYRFALAGGGTGGHVIPAIAVAEELEGRGHEVCFIGTRDRIEAEIVPKAGFPIRFIRARPLVGKSVAKIVAGLVAAPLSVLASARLLGVERIDAVLGVGGYVSGPVMAAAKLRRIPLALLEQNAMLGLSNRLIARFADRAFVSYEETLNAFPKGRAELTGNPVKASILAAARASTRRNGSTPVRIVVMGGSQGALAIDQRAPAAIGLLGIEDTVSVLHQCGPDREAVVQEVYRKAGIDARVVRFIDDTAAAYRRADLVVARSGATTVSEVSVMGLPAVFLPYPHHADQQQLRNADPMRRAGAAQVLDEKKTGVDDLAAAIGCFVKDKEKRRAAARASAGLGRPDAAKRVADGLLGLVSRRRR